MWRARDVAPLTRGLLVAFEGLDGSGKSTQLARLAARTRAAGHTVVCTREPTAGPYGQRIREMARSGARVPPEQELEWFLADRREHVRDVLAPALTRGDRVLTDRYFLSTVAYQGARGLDADALLAQAEAEFPLPDLVVLTEIDPAAGLARVHARADDPEPAFEEQSFLERVAAVFAGLDRPYLKRVDARGSEDAVEAAIQALLAEHLPSW
ncbi:MAG: dTMP kinase [Proteobacteria bacterium]|nr:dTMP kinase [Pseudomonadota bacterium]